MRFMRFMHSHARHWPKFLWTLGIIVILAVVYNVAPMPFVKPYIDSGTVAAVTIVLILPLFSLTLVAGLIMRHDEHMRARAILGDTAGMPLARKQPARLNDSDEARKPLELTWNMRGKTGTLTASDTGLVLRRPRRQDVHLAWGEIRLFEVGYIHQGENIASVPGYCVYGGDGQYIEWPGQLVSLKPTIDSSLEEYRLRQTALLSLVVARTGLPLRTLMHELSTTGEMELPTARMVRKGGRALGALFFVLAVVTSLIAGVLSLTLPLTRTLAFNIYVSIVSVVYGIYLLRPAQRAVLAFIRSAEMPLPVVLPHVPAGLQPNTSVALKVVSDPRKRLGSLLHGFLLLGTLIPLWFSRFDFPRSYYVDQSITNLYGDLRFVVFLVGMLMGYFYLMTAIFSLPRHPAGPQADERGLYLGRGKAQQFIPWRDIDLFIATVSPSGPTSYMATGNGIRMEWTANALWVQPPDGAAFAAAGAQFAAIVAQRAGVQPTTQWE
jgi:hypothetical protein